MVSDLAGHEDEDQDLTPDQPQVDTALPSLAEQGVPRNPAPKTPAPAAEVLPPEWRHDSAIICIAGRGPLDEAASAMLAQLLQKHGLGAHLVPHEAVSRDRIATFDTAGAAMVCVSYLEISGSPAHLRYLLRRLRQRLPKAPILVGLWPAEEEVLTDQQVQAFLGADYYTTSLREAVKACLEAAHKASASPAPATGCTARSI